MSTVDYSTIDWLLEDNNPAIKYRTQTELLGEKSNKKLISYWINNHLPTDWREAKGLWRTYYLTAIAECGLSLDDMNLDENNVLLMQGGNGTVDNNCGDFMYLRALVQLGFYDNLTVQNTLKSISDRILPDGGFLCLHRLDKLKYTPKSCVKANMHALLLCSECKKRGVYLPFTEKLLDYFWNHNIFYRTDNPETLILNAREGWRTIDNFYPFEVMRIGLQNVLEAFCALGYGNDVRLREAWSLIENQKTDDGKYILNGTLTKSYLPKEKIGKPSKWVTFYTLLAQKERELIGIPSVGKDIDSSGLCPSE